jgi:hypothetical protein
MRPLWLWRVGFVVLVSGAAVGCAEGAAESVTAPSLDVDVTTVVCTRSAPRGWVLQTAAPPDPTSAAFANGPSTPPLGIGSVELAVGANGASSAQLRSAAYGGVRLGELRELRYSTFVRRSGSGSPAPYLILDVDYTGDGRADDFLVFEPVYQSLPYFPPRPQPAPRRDEWQTWDALRGGWWSVYGTADATPGMGVKSLSRILAARPGARIVNSAATRGGVRLVAGLGAHRWSNFLGYVDRIVVDVTTYDFDFDRADCAGDGWRSFTSPSFRNRNQCRRYFGADGDDD